MLQETPIYMKFIGVVVDDNCYDVTNQSPPRHTANDVHPGIPLNQGKYVHDGIDLSISATIVLVYRWRTNVGAGKITSLSL